MKKNIAISTLVFILSSCFLLKKMEKKEILFTDQGFQYEMISESVDTLQEPQVGDRVWMRYKVVYKDSVIYKRFQPTNPEIVKLGFGRQREAVEHAAKYLEKGDVARFSMRFSDIKSRVIKGLNDTDHVSLVLAIDSIEYHPELYPYETTGKDTVTLESGLQYVVIKEGTGEQVKKGDKITVHYTGFLENGDIFDSSVDRNAKFESPIGVGKLIKGWDEGFVLFKVGTKVKLIIPANLAYGNRNIGRIPANSTLVFDVEIFDTEEPIVAKPFDIGGKEVQEMPSGLQIIMVENGGGKKASVGDKIAVHYTGYLMDGTKFDSSVERGQPIEFVLGMGRVIKGWEEAFTYLKEGDKAQIIIPANLAYGNQRRGRFIKPNSDLKFDVELIKVYR